MGKKSKDFLAKNIVSILFAVMCVGAFFASKVSFSYFLQELITRIVRNSVLVLALIIPVITGLGMNFSIVLGAMAAQAGLILVTHWHIDGVVGIVLSTVLAGLGQIISLQNIGSFATYSAHDTVATYAIAALLVGGATVKQAKVHNVFLGLLLFHALFIVAPQAGNQIFGNPVYGEYFRVFVSYGVIAMALILNAVQTRKLRQQRLRESTRI